MDGEDGSGEDKQVFVEKEERGGDLSFLRVLFGKGRDLVGSELQ